MPAICPGRLSAGVRPTALRWSSQGSPGCPIDQGGENGFPWTSGNADSCPAISPGRSWLSFSRSPGACVDLHTPHPSILIKECHRELGAPLQAALSWRRQDEGEGGARCSPLKSR